jgi:hypothetical protein
MLGESCIYEVERFKGVSLRPETLAFLNRPRPGASVSLLNRFLLEDVYRSELSRIPGIHLPPLVAVVMEMLQANTGVTSEPDLVGWKSVVDLQAALTSVTRRNHPEHSVRQLTLRLRRLLRDHGENPSLVQNDRRLGYRFSVGRTIQTKANSVNN